MADFKLPSIGPSSSAQYAILDSRLKKAQQLASGPQGAPADTAHNKEIEKAATQFEGLLVQEMLKEMWATVPKNGLISGSNEEQTYQDMFQQALADSISQGHGIGVKDVIIRDIKATEVRHKKAGPDSGNGAS